MRRIFGIVALAFVLFAPAAHARTALTGNLVLYINCAATPTSSTTFGTYGGGSDSNPGTLSQPYLTTQAAVNYVWGSLDVQGYEVVFQHSPAKCTKGVITNAFVFGQACCLRASDMIAFRGDPTDYTHFEISAYPGAFLASDSASIYVENMILTCSFAGCNGLETNWQGKIFHKHNIFGNTVGNHLQAITKGHIEAWGNYIVGGNAGAHLSAGTDGLQTLQTGVVVTVSGPPAITVFAAASIHATILSSATWSGAATGKRFQASNISVIYNSTASPFPGSVAGTVAAGSEYTGP